MIGRADAMPPEATPGLPRDADGPVFAEPWEAQAFALAVALHERGCFAWPEFATRLGAAIAADPQAPYYERWLSALEALVAEKGIGDPQALRPTHDGHTHGH